MSKMKVFIVDGKTEKCWHYSDHAASKNDGTLNAHASFTLVQTDLHQHFRPIEKQFSLILTHKTGSTCIYNGQWKCRP